MATSDCHTTNQFNKIYLNGWMKNERMQFMLVDNFDIAIMLDIRMRQNCALIVVWFMWNCVRVLHFVLQIHNFIQWSKQLSQYIWYWSLISLFTPFQLWRSETKRERESNIRASFVLFLIRFLALSSSRHVQLSLGHTFYSI